MEKLHILFILRDCEHGGIPRVLANLLDRVDTDNLQVEVLVANPAGICNGCFRNCRVLPTDFLLRLFCCNYRKEHGCVKLFALAVKLLRYGLRKICGYDIINLCYGRVARRLSDRYDVVWACSDDVPAQIAQRITTPKVLWMHACTGAADFLHAPLKDMPRFGDFDFFPCVSKGVLEAWCDALLKGIGLDIQSRATVLYNIVNDADIRFRAGECQPAELEKDFFNIVSVGRISWVKGFTKIPAICAALKKNGIPFKWFIIGGGSAIERGYLEREIKEQGVEDCVYLLGVKQNPYPYMDKADVLVLTSMSEGYPTVVNEAKALGTPILSTPFQGVTEIMTEKDGWICPVEGMAAKLTELMQGWAKGDVLKREPVNFGSHNEAVVQKFMDILNGLE